MSLPPAAIRAMRAAGLSADQILDVIEKAGEERLARAREGNRRRQAAYKARQREEDANEANESNAAYVDNGVSDVNPVTVSEPSRACSITNLPSEDISYPPCVPPKAEDRTTASRKASRAKPRSRISADAVMGELEREAARSAGLSEAVAMVEWRKYVTHHVAKGSLMADWLAAWANWCARVDGWARQRPGYQPAGPGSWKSPVVDLTAGGVRVVEGTEAYEAWLRLKPAVLKHKRREERVDGQMKFVALLPNEYPDGYTPKAEEQAA